MAMSILSVSAANAATLSSTLNRAANNVAKKEQAVTNAQKNAQARQKAREDAIKKQQEANDRNPIKVSEKLNQKCAAADSMQKGMLLSGGHQ